MRPQALWIGGAVLVLETLLGLAPRADRLTWAMENFPVWIGLGLLFRTENKFPVSSLCLGFLALHAVVLMVGGYYTYAKVPLGDWMREWFGFTRNHYDRIGHFAQGFVPALLVRELLLRRAGLARNWWLPFLTVSVCLAFSAFYEFIEWWTALATGDAANDFLGTQGDPWDTQWDMCLAFLGAILAGLTMSRWHDCSLAKLPSLKSHSPK